MLVVAIEVVAAIGDAAVKIGVRTVDEAHMFLVDEEHIEVVVAPLLLGIIILIIGPGRLVSRESISRILKKRKRCANMSL